jgi:hypothetical protein
VNIGVNPMVSPKVGDLDLTRCRAAITTSTGDRCTARRNL